jgi:AraC family transcriptional regulator
MTTDPRVHVVEVVGGTYAVGTHIGPHNQLPIASRHITKWLASNGYAPGTGETFEVYLDDGSKVPQSQLRTEICIPVKAPV